MIYFLLILFFASLFSIVFMIGRKLIFLKNEEIKNQEEILLELPYLKEVKNVTVAGMRKHGYSLLVAIIRSYIRFIKFLKDRYEGVKIKVKEMKNKKHGNGEKKEISKFLKVVSDYKQKIREIKHRIRKEENL